MLARKIEGVESQLAAVEKLLGSSIGDRKDLNPEPQS
jgi:hypothetical protein